jgi:hypothetical protein
MSTKSDVPWVYLCLKVQYAWPQAGARLALGLPHAWPANGTGEQTARSASERERDRAGAGRRAAVVSRVGWA